MNAAGPALIRRPLREPGAAGRAWRWALAVTAAIAVVTACLFPLVNATWAARLERDESRTPHPIAYVSELSGGPPPAAAGLYDLSHEQVGDVAVQVIWLARIREDAPPPPGLSRWPGAREVMASPALLAMPGGREFAQRYGAVAGIIAPAGLVNPGERLLYAGMDPNVFEPTTTMVAIDYFGSPRGMIVSESGATTKSDQGTAGDVLYQWNRIPVFTVLGLFAVAPTLVLLGVAVRLGGERRDQYAVWLSMIGASPARQRRFVLREAGMPVVAGALAGFGLVAASMTGTWRVPVFGAYIVGPYLRSAWPWCLAAGMAAAGIVLVAVVLANRVRRPGRASASPKAAAAGARPWLLVAPGGVIALQAWLYAVTFPTDPGAAATISTVAAGLAIVMLAPCGGAFVALGGRVCYWMARRFSSPAGLATARELAALPRPAQRTSAVVAAAIVLSVQALLLVAGPSHFESEARRLVASDPGLVVSIGEASRDSWLPEVAAGLPPRYAVVRVARSEGGGPAVARSTCEQVARLGATCPQGWVSLGDVLASQPPAVRTQIGGAVALSTPLSVVDSLAGVDGSVLVVSADGRRIDANELTGKLAALISPAPVIVNEWSAFLAGMAIDVAHARWLLLAGLVAGLILLVAASLALWFEAIRVARRTASLAMMMDRARTTNLLGLGLVGVPIACATLLGIGAALGLAIAPVTVPGSAVTMPWRYFGVALGAGGLLAAVTGLLAARVIRARAERWVPAVPDL